MLNKPAGSHDHIFSKASVKPVHFLVEAYEIIRIIEKMDLVIAGNQVCEPDAEEAYQQTAVVKTMMSFPVFKNPSLKYR